MSGDSTQIPVVVFLSSGTTETGYVEYRIEGPSIKLENQQRIVKSENAKYRLHEMETEAVPIIGDIPLLGLFFRNKKEVEQVKELIIYIHPIILEPEQQGIPIYRKPEELPKQE